MLGKGAERDGLGRGFLLPGGTQDGESLFAKNAGIFFARARMKADVTRIAGSLQDVQGWH